MVTTAQHETLQAECIHWREGLRLKRDEINQMRNRLYAEAASRKTDTDFMPEADHYHHLFHIQSINIHDLKHVIKQHVGEANYRPSFGHKIPHRKIQMSYELLSRDIEQLKNNFTNFIQ